MSKYIVETFYTCTFKTIHTLDELSEKKLSDLEKRNDGEVQIIDVKLNNRKTKKANNKDKQKEDVEKFKNDKIENIASAVNDTIINSNNLKIHTIKNCKNFIRLKLYLVYII